MYLPDAVAGLEEDKGKNGLEEMPPAVVGGSEGDGSLQSSMTESLLD